MFVATFRSCHCSGSTEPQQPFTPSAFSDKPDLNLATPNPLLPLNQNRNPIPPSLAKNRRSLLAARPETVTLSHRGPAPNPKLQPRRSLMTQSPAVKHNAHQVLAGNPPNPRRSVVGTPSHSARTPLRHGVTPAVPERKPHSYLRRSVASTVHSATASAKKPPVSSYVRDTPSLPKSTTAGTPQRSRSQAITTPSNAHLMNTPSKPNPSMVRRSLIATPSKLNPPSQIATPSSSLTRGTPMGMSKATPMSMSKTNPMSMTKATPMSMSKAPSISFPSTKSKPPLGMFRPRAGLTVASGPASRKALVATQQFGSRTIRPADDGDLGVRALNSMTPSGNQSLGMRSRRVSGLPSPIRKIH